MKGKQTERRSWQRGIRFCMAVATLALPLADAGARAGVIAGDSPPATGTLLVTLSGMKEDRGQLVYAMWSGPEGWLETNAVREGSAPIVEGSGSLRFENLPHGEYAISAYHDLILPHEILLGAGVIPVEGLLLADIKPGLYQLFCLPLKIAGCDGAPARVILVSSD